MPSKSKPIQVTLSGTGSVGGQKAKVTNRTTNEVHPYATYFDANKILTFDCADFVDGWTTDDVLEVIAFGPCFGTALVTLTASKSQKATLAGTQLSATLPKGGT